MSSPSTPSTDGGVRSWVITSHATTSSTATLELLREEAGERAFLGLPEPPHRHDVLLPVEHHTALVHVTVEVDRELRQPEQRPIDFDESHLTTSQRDSSRETEVAVEPRVDERAAVHVDADLAVARRCPCRGAA